MNDKEKEALENDKNSKNQDAQPRTKGSKLLSDGIDQDIQPKTTGKTNTQPHSQDSDLPTYTQIYSDPQASNQVSSGKYKYSGIVQPEPQSKKRTLNSTELNSQNTYQDNITQQEPSRENITIATSSKTTPICIICPNCRKSVDNPIKRRPGFKSLIPNSLMGLAILPLSLVFFPLSSLKKRRFCPYCGFDLSG
ncbi:hypothetical protein AYI68_g1207 [Smittium mucronatum]|uniref:LITAF domain-containing protein n=1 Tax=Smittium mucronatum TaxID=133383 RepID=A0A1R0H6B2_9FUNG|nr:hypothetical protein AYI68_g1207 [Smittium mucronatum]